MFSRIGEFHAGGGFLSTAYETAIDSLPDASADRYVLKGIFKHPSGSSTGRARFIPKLTRSKTEALRSPRKLMARLIFFCNRFLRQEFDEVLDDEKSEGFDGLFKVASGKPPAKKPATGEHDEAPSKKKSRHGDGDDSKTSSPGTMC